MEILKKEEYGQFERFLRSQPDVSFMQSAAWRAVKDRWKHEVVVVRDEMGEIVGGMSVLIRTVFPGMTLLYAPRGPVCDLSDEKTVRELLRGAQKLAEKYHAFALKIDPEVPESDRQTIRTLRACGFFHRGTGTENCLGSGHTAPDGGKPCEPRQPVQKPGHGKRLDDRLDHPQLLPPDAERRRS